MTKKIYACVFLFLTAFFNLFAADKMDLMLYNLSDSSDPQGDFRKMSKELTATMAPMFYGEAETRGAAGFEVGLGYSFSKINYNAAYWQLSLNDTPHSSKTPTFYNGLDLHVSKGFSFGLKLFGNLRYYVLSEMLSGGGGFEYAINEGLKKAPDIALGAGYNRLFGASDMNLQMVDFRLKISKTFAVANQIKLIPNLSYSHLLSFASSKRLGGFFDMSSQATSNANLMTQGVPYVTNAKGEPFYFKRETINIDRLFIGFKVIGGYFGFELEAVVPFNAGKSFSINAAISASI